MLTISSRTRINLLTELNSHEDQPTQEQARELLTQQRQHNQDLQEKMLDRAEAEIEVTQSSEAQN